MTPGSEDGKRTPREGDGGDDALEETSRPKPEGATPDNSKPQTPRRRGFDDWASL